MKSWLSSNELAYRDKGSLDGDKLGLDRGIFHRV
jgi:hypothetical protein